jgi:hypothetical protein
VEGDGRVSRQGCVEKGRGIRCGAAVRAGVCARRIGGWESESAFRPAIPRARQRAPAARREDDDDGASTEHRVDDARRGASCRWDDALPLRQNSGTLQPATIPLPRRLTLRRASRPRAGVRGPRSRRCERRRPPPSPFAGGEQELGRLERLVTATHLGGDVLAAVVLRHRAMPSRAMFRKQRAPGDARRAARVDPSGRIGTGGSIRPSAIVDQTPPDAASAASAPRA